MGRSIIPRSNGCRLMKMITASRMKVLDRVRMMTSGAFSTHDTGRHSAVNPMADNFRRTRRGWSCLSHIYSQLPASLTDRFTALAEHAAYWRWITDRPSAARMLTADGRDQRPKDVWLFHHARLYHTRSDKPDQDAKNVRSRAESRPSQCGPEAPHHTYEEV